MIEKIKGLSIQGRCFSTKTALSFYPHDYNRLAIVYGRNGSGKSTISDAFSCISSNILPSDLTASLFDQTDTPISLSDDGKIFVFNEKYIDQNVKIDADGLGTIILLGGQIDLQAEIERYSKMEHDTRTARDTAQTRFDQFCQINDPTSPDYHLARIKKVLQSSWASRDASIKGSKINSKVTESIIKEICELSVSESLAQLQQQFEETQSLLEKISDITASYPTSIHTISISDDFEDNLCNLLAKSVEKPLLTERENLILAAIQNGKQSYVEEAQKSFNHTSTKVCPYCFRPIDEDYKHSLIESINRVLNKDVDTHKNELQSISFPSLTEDYTIFTDLDSKLVEQITAKQSTCINLVSQYNSSIQTKTSNIYTPLHIPILGLKQNIIELNVLLMQLETKRKEFLDATKRRKSIYQDLISINKRIAHMQVDQLYRDYQAQVRAKNSAALHLRNTQNDLNSIVAHLQNLEQKKSNVGLAIDSINNALDYVFFTHGRLSIELKNDRYYLKSNGKDVKPKSISLGERNIIALCYFFTQILSYQDITKLYQDEELVVIDDPISSFDFENKVGICSFLRHQIRQIIKGNNNSKILILTHDLSTVSELQKISEDLEKAIKKDSTIKAVKAISFELAGLQLSTLKPPFNEYQELLKMVYQYATGSRPELTLTIGNAMRRSLEAFSTFIYSKGIVEVSFDPKVMKRLGDRSAYFENLMYRLVLNEESHFVGRLYDIQDDFNFYRFFSDSEKQRTCKDILCFMYCLSPDHIESYLPDALFNIRTWTSNIPKNSTFEIAFAAPNKIIRLYDFPLSAGPGNNLFSEDTSYTEYETANIFCDFALRISGDSMSPGISDGCIVLIQKSDIINDGDVGAFFLNGEVYCKRLVHQDGIPFLVSDNPRYQPIEIHENDTLITYGQVVDVIH
jgi:AAA15 family ATPase/GTPase